ncbi:MAG: nucleoside phosphorylase [Lachnospiraceae bacterium]|nr:nucleoside phosphorylase [Lachnospiraceae bacterium]
MIEQQQLPLLEFDTNKIAKMMPEHFAHLPKKLSPKCVLAFSHTSVEKIAVKYNARQNGKISSCTTELPVYIVDFQGEEIGLVCGFIGAANAAAQIEELYAGGVRNFIACGAAGSLTPQPLGALVIPTAAVRDEGASYHYAPPSYEIEADKDVAACIAKTLKEAGMPYVEGKTWTTDGLYRETEEKIALRKERGCITVEMEASAMIAAARFRGARFGQILYCGDDLSGAGYDHRDFFKAEDVRCLLIELALLSCKNLQQ